MLIDKLILALGLSNVEPEKLWPSNKFEDLYHIVRHISSPSPVFKCTEIDTEIEYVCKFPRISKQLPPEITVIQAKSESSGSEKSLFIEMHQYYSLDRELAHELKRSNFFR